MTVLQMILWTESKLKQIAPKRFILHDTLGEQKKKCSVLMDKL
jgi:hypothetical protein